MNTLLEKLNNEELTAVFDVVKMFEANPETRFYSMQISTYLKTKDHKFLNSRRIRKIINHIRCQRLITGVIIATDGYKMTFDKQEVRNYISSIANRINAINYMRMKTIEAFNEI